MQEKYGKTAAQILLRWSVQNNFIPIPKSSNEERLKENINIFDFELSPEDISLLNSLNEDYITEGRKIKLKKFVNKFLQLK
ncbi:MAG: aldo/keto reductase [Ignavibacteriaceae bacterium]